MKEFFKEAIEASICIIFMTFCGTVIANLIIGLVKLSHMLWGNS